MNQLLHLSPEDAELAIEFYLHKNGYQDTLSQLCENLSGVNPVVAGDFSVKVEAVTQTHVKIRFLFTMADAALYFGGFMAPLHKELLVNHVRVYSQEDLEGMMTPKRMRTAILAARESSL